MEEMEGMNIREKREEEGWGGIGDGDEGAGEVECVVTCEGEGEKGEKGRRWEEK